MKLINRSIESENTIFIESYYSFSKNKFSRKTEFQQRDYDFIITKYWENGYIQTQILEVFANCLL